MEAYKSGKGRVLSQNNYRQGYQTRNRNCYGCGEPGHFVRDCPSKRRNNGAQVKRKNEQKSKSNLNQQPTNGYRDQQPANGYWNQQPAKCYGYWDQQPVMGIWTGDSMGSNFKWENKFGHEFPRKISASNLQEHFSSQPSHFSSASDYNELYSSSISDYTELYSSSASDYSEDYISTALDSLEDYSYAAYGSQFKDDLSSASGSSLTLHLSEVRSSSVLDSSQFSYSSSSDSRAAYSSSDRYKCEGNDLNGFKACEEAQLLQCATFSTNHKESDEYLQSPIGTSAGSLSQISRQVSEESLDSAECHKVVQTMHNLSVLLLKNSSESDNMSKSDVKALQSVICNLSECLMKSTGVSKSTDESIFMPDKQPVAADSEESEKDSHAAENMEDPFGQGFFRMPTEVYQSQMVNIEVELNLIKSEIKCLRSELEMEGLKRTHAGTNEDIETSANKNDVNNGSRPEVNLVAKKNDPDYTPAPFSQERSNWLPDLNTHPIINGEPIIGECYIKKYEDDILSQNNISEGPILLSTTASKPGQSNAEAETEQLEGEFRVLQELSSCSQPDMEYIRDYSDKTLLENGTTNDTFTQIGSPFYIQEIENVDVMHTLDEIPFFASDSNLEQFWLRDGAMSRSFTNAGSPTDVNDLENVDVGHALVENPCSESDSTWEELNFNEEYYI